MPLSVYHGSSMLCHSMTSYTTTVDESHKEYPHNGIAMVSIMSLRNSTVGANQCWKMTTNLIKLYFNKSHQENQLSKNLTINLP